MCRDNSTRFVKTSNGTLECYSATVSMLHSFHNQYCSSFCLKKKSKQLSELGNQYNIIQITYDIGHTFH